MPGYWPAEHSLWPVPQVSWSELDYIILTADESLPTWLDGKNGLEKVNGILNAPLKKVDLGKGQMSVEGVDVEIWTRLLMGFGHGWLEVFNALDENGYVPKGILLRASNIALERTR